MLTDLKDNAIGTEDLVPIPSPPVNEKSQHLPPHQGSGLVPVTSSTAPGLYDDSDSDSLGELPTDEELYTLRRVADKIPWHVYTLAFVELCERFSYYGATVVCK
jgi:hypothetical protein